MAIQSNTLLAAHRHGVKRLLFLGSSCIYPKLAEQPIRENSLLTGALESTNRAYALAKIAGIELCWSLNRQYGANFLAAMPTNLYGPGDNYHPENSHVIPGLLRRFHEAKVTQQSDVIVWGTGNPKREFMYSDDMAGACVHLMRLPAPAFTELLGSQDIADDEFAPPLINIGTGSDVSIQELSKLIAGTVGYQGEICFDSSKPDGTPRKLLDIARLTDSGFTAATDLATGLSLAYQNFLEIQN